MQVKAYIKNGFPIEMNYSPIHGEEKTYPSEFFLAQSSRSRVYEEKENRRKKKKIDAHRWPRYIFFMLWNHLQLEYTCTAARHKMESRAGRDLTGVGTNLKLQRDLLFAAKRIDADVRFWLL